MQNEMKYFHLPDFFRFLYICHTYVFQYIKQILMLDKDNPRNTKCILY